MTFDKRTALKLRLKAAEADVKIQTQDWKKCEEAMRAQTMRLVLAWAERAEILQALRGTK